MLPMKRGYSQGVELTTHCENCGRKDKHWYCKQSSELCYFAYCSTCGFMVAESYDKGKHWADDSEGNKPLRGQVYHLRDNSPTIPTKTKIYNGFAAIVPAEAGGYDLEDRQERWAWYQMFGLPCPDLTTGKVQIVPPAYREQFKRFIEMSKFKESAK